MPGSSYQLCVLYGVVQEVMYSPHEISALCVVQEVMYSPYEISVLCVVQEVMYRLQLGENIGKRSGIVYVSTDAGLNWSALHVFMLVCTQHSPVCHAE